jgi:hypothetical protein
MFTTLALTLTPFVEAVADRLGVSYRTALLSIIGLEVADLTLLSILIYTLVR